MKEWMVWEKIRRIFPLQTLEFLTDMSRFSKPGVPVASGVKFENKNIELISIEDQFIGCGKSVANALVSDPEWLDGNLNTIDRKTGKYFEVAEQTLSLNFQKLSNQELLETFEKMYDAYIASHTSGVLTTMSEFREEFLSMEVKKRLVKKLKEKNVDITPPKAFALLSHMQRPSVLSKERYWSARNQE